MEVQSAYDCLPSEKVAQIILPPLLRSHDKGPQASIGSKTKKVTVANWFKDAEPVKNKGLKVSTDDQRLFTSGTAGSSPVSFVLLKIGHVAKSIM
jgi:hypothetical protein